jgi:hypothetical protein
MNCFSITTNSIKKIFPVCRNLKQAEKKMPSRTTTEASLHGKVGPHLREKVYTYSTEAEFLDEI